MGSKKTVYTVANIKAVIDGGVKEFVLDDKVVLTPSAADVLREHGVRIVTGRGLSANNGAVSSKPAFVNNKTADNEEETVRKLVNILRNKFNITDKNTIEDVIVVVLKTMRQMK